MELQQSNVVAPLNEIALFDYSTLDAETASYLRQKEINIRGIALKTLSDIGKELKDAQERLAKRGYGCFEEWYTSLGLKRQSVYNYINYHNLILQQLEERELIEGLPKPLAYEIAKPSTPEDLRQKVLSGDIKTTKEFQDEVRARKAAEKAAAEAKAEAERLAEDNAELRKANKELELKSREQKIIEKVVEKPVEIMPPEVQQKLSEAEAIKQEYNSLKEEAFQLRMKVMQKDMEEKDRLQKARIEKKALDKEFEFLLGKMTRFLFEVSPYIVLADMFMSMEPDKAKEHEATLSRVAEWVRIMKEAMPYGGEIIEMKGVVIDV